MDYTHRLAASSPVIKRREKFFIWAGCFFFFFLIMACAPYTYDDYEFASLKFNSFKDLANYCLTYGNGRFLGNLLGVLSNQLPVFGAFCKALVLSITVLLLPGLLGLRSRFSMAVSFLLVTAIDPSLFAQVFTWTSGFANYVPPAILMLIAVYLIQQYPACSGMVLNKICLCLLLVILGVSAQLFIEHSSIINVFFAVMLLVKVMTERDRFRGIPAVCLFAALLLGLGLMFWIPGRFMSSVNDHTSGYRSLHVDSLYVFVFNCARNALRLTNHYLGLCGIPLCAGAAITVHQTRGTRSERPNRILSTMSVLPGLYLLFCTLMDSEGWYAEPTLIHHALAMVMVLSALAAWVIALARTEDTLLRNRVYALLFLAVFSLLPLLIVTPIHIRVVYHSQLFIVCAFLLCLCKAADTWTPHLVKAAAKGVFCCVLAVILTLVPVFLSIRSMTQARSAYIASEMENGSRSIEVFRIPYNYVHDATDAAMGDYHYYTSRRDIEFNNIPFDQWMNDHWDAAQQQIP